MADPKSAWERRRVVCWDSITPRKTALATVQKRRQILKIIIPWVKSWGQRRQGLVWGAVTKSERKCQLRRSLWRHLNNSLEWQLGMFAQCTKQAGLHRLWRRWRGIVWAYLGSARWDGQTQAWWHSTRERLCATQQGRMANIRKG